MSKENFATFFSLLWQADVYLKKDSGKSFSRCVLQSVPGYDLRMAECKMCNSIDSVGTSLLPIM